ncbi:hypothetical protein [Mycobacterium riyadhense]|uniref:hypothetical protein n=1 Tax=Mycobacterium riyadhense TaxID=486698 RepID=UPI001EF9F295|nr:hypothetical protein [Mycobacterium riyadhense]
MANDLPHAQQLGVPDPEYRQTRTAIDRAAHHVAATNTPSTERSRAEQLLRQRDQVLGQLADIATSTARLDAIAARDRARGRDQDRGNGLEL